ncbi:MAG: SDR family oxidoreductase [Myxococcales bacterium]|nr:SDR family oxidoreductase [Myxococcales bacterium]
MKGKSGFVGGSSRGLGLAIARELLSEGASVAISGRDAARLEGVAAALAQEFGAERVLPVAADLAEPTAIDNALARARDHFGSLQFGIANAGGPPAGPAIASSEGDWQRAFDLHLIGALRFARNLLPHFDEQGFGRLLFLTSVAVKQPLPNLGISNGIRAGVAGLAKTLSLESRHPAVTINCILPGYTRTERLDELAAALAARQGGTPGEVFERWEAEIPLRRIARPDELARVAVFLVSEAASYINGVALAVDGGLSRALL